MSFDLMQFVDHLAPTFGVGITGYFGYLAAKSSNMSKSQTKEIKSELQIIKDDVVEVKQVGNSNFEKIDKVSKRLKIHDDSHLIQMYLRLDRELNRALKNGFTTKDDFAILNKMFNNYKELGGNGYIERLYHDYLELEIKENEHD